MYIYKVLIMLDWFDEVGWIFPCLGKKMGDGKERKMASNYHDSFLT